MLLTIPIFPENRLPLIASRDDVVDRTLGFQPKRPWHLPIIHDYTVDPSRFRPVAQNRASWPLLNNTTQNRKPSLQTPAGVLTAPV